MKNILYQESIVEIKHLFRMMRNTVCKHPIAF